MNIAPLGIPEALNAVPTFMDYTAKLRKNFINRNAFLHSCDYEARLNLEIISEMKYEKLNTDEIKNILKSKTFMKLVNNLETIAIKTMMFGNDRRSYRRLIILLNKNMKNKLAELNNNIKDEENGESLNKTPDKMIKSLLDSFSFAVRKTETLKRIINISNECDDSNIYFENIKLEIRLNNLNYAFLTIHNCLKEVIDKTEKPCCL